MTEEVTAAAAAQDSEGKPATAAPEMKMPAPNPPEHADAAPALHDDPMAKAVAHGYVEPAAPSHEERVKALIGDFEHAMANNAPMTQAMLTELKALLTGE